MAKPAAKETPKIEPFNDTVAILPRDEAAVTSGGILLPDNRERRTFLGEVIAVGAECKYAKVGDTVVFSRYSGSEVEIAGRTVLVMGEKSVHGRI